MVFIVGYDKSSVHGVCSMIKFETPNQRRCQILRPFPPLPIYYYIHPHDLTEMNGTESVEQGIQYYPYIRDPNQQARWLPEISARTSRRSHCLSHLD